MGKYSVLLILVTILILMEICDCQNGNQKRKVSFLKHLLCTGM